MSLLEKINDLKDYYDDDFKYFLKKNRDYNHSYFIRTGPESILENLFNRLREPEKKSNYSSEFIFDSLKVNYDKHFGIINPELHSLVLKEMYDRNKESDYPLEIVNFLESEILNSFSYNPANYLINSLSYSILYDISDDDKMKDKAKSNFYKANKKFHDGSNFYLSFMVMNSIKDYACFKNQYSNTLIDLVDLGYDMFDENEKYQIKQIVKENEDFKRCLRELKPENYFH